MVLPDDLVGGFPSGGVIAHTLQELNEVALARVADVLVDSLAHLNAARREQLVELVNEFDCGRRKLLHAVSSDSKKIPAR